MYSEIRDQLRMALIQQVAPAFRSEVPLAQQRQVLDAMGTGAELPVGLEVHPRELAGLPSEWLVNPGHSTEHALLHIHGGGFVMGSFASHRALVSRLALACGVQAVVPEYRLAPEHPFPAALDDAVAVYHALLATGLDARRIVLSGDSAGGGLVLSTLLALRDAGAPLPAAAVVLSPYTDLTFSGESIETHAAVDPWLDPSLLEPFARHYAGDRDRADPRISPLLGDLRGLPPLLIHVGDQEILLSDSTRLAEQARAAGVAVELKIWPEVWHVFQFFAPALPDAAASLGDIGAFVRAKLGLA